MKITETNLQFKELHPRKLTQRIIIHHSASLGDEDATWLHRLHLNQNGWAGVGYHLIIKKDGEIQRGRPEAMTGAHAGAAGNINSIGICLVGHFDRHKPTDAQMKSLVWLINYLCGKYGPLDVIGHKDVMATACPGKLFPWTELKQMLGGGQAMAEKPSWKEQIIADALTAGLITSQHDPDEKTDKWFVLAIALNLMKAVKK